MLEEQVLCPRIKLDEDEAHDGVAIGRAAGVQFVLGFCVCAFLPASAGYARLPSLRLL